MEHRAFGRSGILDYAQTGVVANYVYALSHPKSITTDNRDEILAGRAIFEANCTTCHGPAARGNSEIGAPDLTDPNWIYGGDLTDIITAVHEGRQGHMPTWEARLSDVEIKILALYVHSLEQEEQ